jgi:hypothetical protein
MTLRRTPSCRRIGASRWDTRLSGQMTRLALPARNAPEVMDQGDPRNDSWSNGFQVCGLTSWSVLAGPA